MDGGEPDAFVANLDGGGLRLSGEPNPVGIGAGADSLLRAENLAKVIAAARKAAPADARVTDFDIRPDRVGFELETGGRELTLDYGYDAQLTGRDAARRGPASTPGRSSWEQIDPAAPERMARAAKKALGEKLADVQYVLLSLPILGEEKPALSMYFPSGHDPPYGVADLHGRHFTWPGAAASRPGGRARASSRAGTAASSAATSPRAWPGTSAQLPGWSRSVGQRGTSPSTAPAAWRGAPSLSSQNRSQMQAARHSTSPRTSRA